MGSLGEAGQTVPPTPASRRQWAIMDVSPVLRSAIKDEQKLKIFDNDDDVTHAPVAWFYDMDLLDAHMQECCDAFGPTVQHRIAMKSNSCTRMLQHACKKFPQMGAEAASIGETLHAINHCGISKDRVVFDSPCKTEKELAWAIKEKIWTNLDNLQEFERAKAIVAGLIYDGTIKDAATDLGVIGMRINPLVGAGEIAALSVSTKASKFGSPLDETTHGELVQVYIENPWMNSVHVHVGSGGMGVQILTAGIKKAVQLAKDVNEKLGKTQVTHIDIGGGLPANYGGDSWAAGEKIPTYTTYAEHLKKELPELFNGDFQVITEFGQSMNAKAGFLASRVEWIKGTEEKPIAIIHFGGAECIRQVYGGAPHNRRVEAYKGDGSRFTGKENEECYGSLTHGMGDYSVGGPLCFQGDFIAKDLKLPKEIKSGDYIVMKDAGANTFSIFSRHCSRLCPAIFGYRWNAEGTEVDQFIEMKPRETMEGVSSFWGPTW